MKIYGSIYLYCRMPELVTEDFSHLTPVSICLNFRLIVYYV